MEESGLLKESFEPVSSQTADGVSQEPEVQSAARPDLDSTKNAEGLVETVERFTLLGTELREFLTDLSHNITASVEQLKEVRSAVEIETQEMERLHKIDLAATELEKLLEDHQREKEQFESLMENQRQLWEDEKARHAEEEKAYLENLKSQRELDEEEYNRRRALLEDEMEARRQKNTDEQLLLEKNWQERELSLKEKETEWVRLVGELNEFLSKLASRT